jgi:peptide deformylase
MPDIMEGPGDGTGRETILLLGDPGLRQVCEPVQDFGSPAFRRDGDRLIRALEQFRRDFGYGRGIAAPQIGIPRRLIAMNLGPGPFLLVNPVLTVTGERTFTLWDDCMSFPWLMIRLARHADIAARFRNADGEEQRWDRIEPAVAELLQHEVDHLDGVLAVDRALDRESIIAREVYLQRRRLFDRQVDYTIVPTVQAP